MPVVLTPTNSLPSKRASRVEIARKQAVRSISIMEISDKRSALKNQAGGCTMGEQTPLAIGDAPFGGADTPAAAQHDALGLDLSGLGRNRPQQRNLELERRLPDAFLEGRLDRQSHATVEQRGRQTAVHRAG